ncbi:MAG: nucleoside hydrolase, partial [Cyclobacteriaceae bacterium]
KGPKVSPVIGRHGGEFTCFGDYAVSLFSKIDLYGDPPSRALFDLVAVSILKNPDWGEQTDIPAPVLINNQWIERPENTRTITIWENFDKDAILGDLYTVIQ